MGRLHVEIDHEGGGSGLSWPVILVIGAIVLFGGGSAASGLVHGTETALMWLAGIVIAVIVAIAAVLIAFRRQITARIRRPLVVYHDRQDALLDKRIELERIRATRVMLEAARAAGQPVTPEMLSLPAAQRAAMRRDLHYDG